MRRLLTAILFIAALPCVADTPCPPPSAEHVFIHFIGGRSGCSAIGGQMCHVGEPVAFEAKTFHYTFCGDETLTWNFGDGVVATGPTVTHSYAGYGVFMVTLTIASPAYTLSLSRMLQLGPIELPPTPIIWEPLVIDGKPVPRGIRFTANAGPGPWIWDFGDGSKSVTTTARQVDHIYANNGSYVVNHVDAGSGRRIVGRIEVAPSRARSVRH